MSPNIGNTDRIIRIVMAVIFAALYFTGTVTGTLGIVLMILAAIFAATSFIKFCPLYYPFGIRTNKPENKK